VSSSTPTEARAPIPANDLERVCDPNSRAARTMPSSAYISSAVFAWEHEHLFDRAWVCVGRRQLVDAPGDQHAIAVGTRDVLLTRDSDGVLHAFMNSCRHRGHEILAVGESANGKFVRCPYHSWVYCLDGALRAAPRFQKDPGFDADSWPLLPVRAIEWLGWIFVAFSAETIEFPDWVTDLANLLGPWKPETMVVGAARSYQLATNWKTVVENYAECYHCSTIHPELCRVSPPDDGAVYEHSGRWNGARMGLREHAETMSLDGRSGARMLDTLTLEESRHVHYFYVAPNLLIALHPDYILTHRLSPQGPGVTVVDCQWLFPPDVVSSPGFDPSYAVDFWDVTNRQDFGACESVYRSISGGGYRPGVFAEQEQGVRNFQVQVAQAYEAGAWVQAPSN